MLLPTCSPCLHWLGGTCKAPGQRTLTPVTLYAWWREPAAHGEARNANTLAAPSYADRHGVLWPHGGQEGRDQPHLPVHQQQRLLDLVGLHEGRHGNVGLRRLPQRALLRLEAEGRQRAVVGSAARPAIHRRPPQPPPLWVLCGAATSHHVPVKQAAAAWYA